MLFSKKKAPTMSRVHAAWSLFEAHLVLDALRGADIDAELRNERLSGGMGGLPVNESMVEVWVPVEDAAQAEALAKSIVYGDAKHPVDAQGLDPRAEPHLAVDTDPCPKCGAAREIGYDTCWNCCATLPID